MAVIYTTPADLLQVVNETTLAALCEAAGLTVDDDEVIDRVRAQASHVAAEIEAALAHRFAALPAPFVVAQNLTGTVILTAGSTTVTAENGDLENELAAGDGIGDGLGHWAQVKTVNIVSGEETTVTLEAGWPAATFEGTAVKGEVQSVIRWISRYLTLESLLTRNPSYRGAAAWAEDVGRARKMLDDIREGCLSLYGVELFAQGRCDAIDGDGNVLDYATEDIYGYRTRYSG